MTVQFSDFSTGDVTGWFWDFGDGQTASTPSPQHIYASSGTYDVSLTASGPAVIEVQIDGSIAPPIGDRARAVAGFIRK